jgi:hypothetical protein
MKFYVRVSPRMESKSSPLGCIEDRLIRIPDNLRMRFGVMPGLFLCLKDKNGNKILLQVARAYRHDVDTDPNCVYISTSTYQLLDTEKIERVKPATDILIGCDPEFYLVDIEGNHNISASHFFPHYGDVGSDCGLAELRPRPAFTQAELSHNLHGLIKKANYHVKNRVLFKKRKISMMASSYLNGASAGFHVHFGLPQNLLRTTPETLLLMAFIVNVLDYYVGVPSILPEGNIDFKRRSPRFSKFGKPGDHRYDLMTLEYRVPGGHLLRHPVLSAGLFAISIVVMKDILSRLEAYTDNFKNLRPFKEYNDIRHFYPQLPDRQKVYDSITSETTDMALKEMDIILKDLPSMIGYKENAEAILMYFERVIYCISKGAVIGADIKENWRLEENEEQQGEMAILC